ncbi:MAG: SRPBCC family protein [Deltaproteobacteria bacterium]|nr:SRPBCC family protein [Deltaproteobacteria bacterium]
MTKLNVTTPDANEIHMTRAFNAPRRLVVKAMTTPELIKRWLGGRRTTVSVAEVDLRVGGSYRYVFRLPDGNEFFFTGVYSEISEDRIVHTELFNGEPPGAVVTTTLVEEAGKTTLHIVMRFESQAVRDMVVGTGMADGAGESYDELDKLLTSL